VDQFSELIEKKEKRSYTNKYKEIKMSKNKNEKPQPKMRTGPTVGPRKASKVSDIF
jgi:hypothetical protein